MGAQHSSQRGGVRLRRRAPTAGVASGAELQSDLVDIAHAVKLVEAQRQAQQQQQQGGLTSQPGTPSQPGAATRPVTAGQLSGQASPRGGDSPLGVRSPVHPQFTGTGPGKPPARAGPLHPSAQALQAELPPWEVIACLGDSEWFAFRAWLDAGWRCRKCGHVRDDHGDHPRALRLLCQCGVPVPNFNPRQHTRPSCPSSPSSRGLPSVAYASESPDKQFGYLSEQSSRSTSSSRAASPLRAQGCPMRVGGGGESPRFANDVRGSKLSFPERGRAEQEHAQGADSLASQPQRTSSGPLQLQVDILWPGDAAPGQEDCLPAPNSIMNAKSGSSIGSISFREGMCRRQEADAEGVRLKVLQQMEAEWRIKDKILRAVSRANQIYFVDQEPNGTLVFDFLLSALLDITNSSFGWISSALLKADGTPYLKTHAITNVCWNKELRAWYAANAHKGLVFTNLNSLHGSIVYTGQPVITNDAARDPRARGVPTGHPAIEKFLGIPLFTGSELIGIYGVANSPDGYSEQQQRLLEPLTLTIAQMMYAVNERKRRKEAELQLSSVAQLASEGIISMSSGGQITSINLAAREMFGLMPADSADGLPHGPSPPQVLSNDLVFTDLVPEIDGRTNYLRKGLDPGAGHKHVGVGRRTDGTLFPLEVSIAKGAYGTSFYVAVLKQKLSQVFQGMEIRSTGEKSAGGEAAAQSVQEPDTQQAS